MRRLLPLLALLVVALPVLAENFRLYLKSGDYQLVREYHVQGDRVRYFSTDEGSWEEIPAALVDVSKTEAERKERIDSITRSARADDEEEKAQRALRKQLERIPMNAGAYYEVGDQIKDLPQADYKVNTDKKRQALKVMSPLPMIAGKATVQIAGAHSRFLVNEERPDFYLRLAKQERFAIIRLTPKKDVRIVENISIIPVANENVEQQDEIPTFQQELGNSLFKVWPEKALTPGEYALVEYAPGEVELMIWDFACQPVAKAPSAPGK